MGNGFRKSATQVKAAPADSSAHHVEVLPAMSTASAAPRVMPRPGQHHLGVKVISTFPLSKDGAGVFCISSGSVVDFEGDAIVNAANEGCITGGGVDGAVTSAGGNALADARRALPIIPGTRSVRCQTGDAVITIGGNLKAQYCIHAVGPNYGVQLYSSKKMTLEDCDALVASAYQKSLLRAQEKALTTIGFSLLSSGIFRGPQSLEKVLHAGVQGVLRGIYPEVEEVHLIAFTRAELETLQDVCEAILGESASPHSPPSAAPGTPSKRLASDVDAKKPTAATGAPPVLSDEANAKGSPPLAKSPSADAQKELSPLGTSSS